MVEHEGEGNTPSELRGYNGWRNYETWCVNLWLKNAEEQNWRFQHLARTGTPPEELADAIRRYFETLHPLDDKPSLYNDLLTHALQQMSWDDIAHSLYE